MALLVLKKDNKLVFMLQISEQTVEPHIKQQCGQANIKGPIMKNMSNCIAQNNLHHTDALLEPGLSRLWLSRWRHFSATAKRLHRFYRLNHS